MFANIDISIIYNEYHGSKYSTTIFKYYVGKNTYLKNKHEFFSLLSCQIHLAVKIGN